MSDNTEVKGPAKSLAKQIAEQAASFAARVAHNATIQSAVDAALDDAEKVKRSAVVFYFLLKDVYGGEMDAFPDPESEREPGSNKPFDRYKVPVVIDGETKTVSGSWYNDFFDSTDIGKAIAKELADITLGKKGDANAPAHYRNLSPVQYKAFQKRWEARRTNGRALYKRAVIIHKTFLWINATKTAKADWITVKVDGEQVLTKSHVCIYVKDLEDESGLRVKAMSAGQFITLDQTKAEKAGMSWEAIINSSGRSTGSGTETAPTVTFDTAEERIAMLNHFFDADETQSKLYNRLANGKVSEGFIEAIGDLYHHLDAIFPKIENRYTKLKAKQATEAS